MIRRILSAEWIVRIGLGIMYVYSGYHLVTGSASAERFLMVQGVVELAIAAALLLWFVPRKISMIAAFLSGVEIILMLILAGVDETTFRNIGLIGASFAAYVLIKEDIY